jgi:hypothetical protein
MCKRNRQRSEFRPYDLNRNSVRDKCRRNPYSDNVRGSVVPLERYWVELRRLQYKLRQLKRRFKRGIRSVDYRMAAMKQGSLFVSRPPQLSVSAEPRREGLDRVNRELRMAIDLDKHPFYDARPAPTLVPDLYHPGVTIGCGGVYARQWRNGPWLKVDDELGRVDSVLLTSRSPIDLRDEKPVVIPPPSFGEWRGNVRGRKTMENPSSGVSVRQPEPFESSKFLASLPDGRKRYYLDKFARWSRNEQKKQLAIGIYGPIVKVPHQPVNEFDVFWMAELNGLA